ncbi:MAG: ABC transporter ATP-binding protein [Elusimicrobiota bacterium]|nr:ABC transporter ATP-binding protein [Elusimicrobiota bacterium]
MNDILLEIKDVVKMFGENMVIDHVSLDIERGKFITFLGASGCGKTTLLRMIAGFYNLDAGQILLDGKDISNLSPQKRNTPMVFQEYALFPHMSVEENISYGLKNRGIAKDEIIRRVKEVMTLVNLSGLEKRYPNQMSGGQQQRVAIARALVNNSQLLLLDEPLSNLDAKLRENVRVELRSIQKKLGITMLYVTHDQQEALSMSDKILVLNHGKIQQYGTPQEIYFNPKTKFVADFIGATNFIEGKNESENGQNAQITYCGQKILTDTQSKAEHITLSIRPESISIGKEKQDNRINIPAVIFNSMFLGEKVRYFAIDETKREWIIDIFDTGDCILSGNVYLSILSGKPHLVL